MGWPVVGEAADGADGVGDLTVLTVTAIKVDFGPRINLLIAMLIATIKASLVVMFFMHLKIILFLLEKKDLNCGKMLVSLIAN